MVTANKEADRACTGYMEFWGLSTDTKPIEKFDGIFFANGSIFVEMDTAKVSFYDATNKVWHTHG